MSRSGDTPAEGMNARIQWTSLRVALVLAAVAFACLLFRHLSYPLLWNDEAYTAVYAERVLEYGFPKVQGPRNVVYALDAPFEVGTKEESGAYVGSPWGQYYVATLGVLAARGTDDLYAKTALLRLPFALLGAVGVAFFLLAALPLIEGTRARIVAAIGYALMSCLSISLILHLREVRYYALVVFLGGCIVLLFRRREISGSLGRGAHAVLLVAALLALFTSYYPAFLVFGVCMALHAVATATRDEAATRARQLGLRLAPLLIAAALALPLALYWEVPEVVAALREGWDASLEAYGRNLAVVAFNLLRFEFLAPVLVAKGGLAFLRGGAPTESGESVRRRLALSHFLTGLLVVYWLVVSRTPFIFERYFVVLSPVLSTLLVLDTSLLVDRLRAGRAGVEASLNSRRSMAKAALALVGIAVVVSVGVRAPELRGRIQELRVPVEGPLDATIPYLAAHYEQPEQLIIATNYEDPAYVYYLGSQVIVGFNGASLLRDMAMIPDVVVPRIWRRHRSELVELLRATDYSRRSFPVYNSRTNNIPSLSPYSPGPLLHRFRTRRPEKPEQAVVLFERSPDMGSGGG